MNPDLLQAAISSGLARLVNLAATVRPARLAKKASVVFLANLDNLVFRASPA